MISLTEALIQRFPHGNEWARQALSALGDGVAPHTMVHVVTQGWTKRTTGDAIELIDTLFILTDDRIGMGQTAAGVGGSHWIPTRSIQAIDALDDSPYPLQTIEVRLLDGTELCLGWTEEFSTELVAVLTRQLAENDRTSSDSMPAELSDPSSVQADASSLDGLAPSPWVEQSLETDIATEQPIETDLATEQPIETGIATEQTLEALPVDAHEPPSAPPVQFALGSMEGIGHVLRPTVDDEPDSPFDSGPPAFSVQSTEDRVDLTSAPPRSPAPHGPAPMFGSRQSGPVIADDLPTELAAPPADEQADPGGAFRAPVGFAPPGAAPTTPEIAPDLAHLPPPPTMSGPNDVLAAGEELYGEQGYDVATQPARPMPWQSPGIAWPETLKSVSYLGGHPGHLRKRKNGAMVFSPVGIDITGSGFQSWSMHIDWSFIDRIEIFGADEVMFTDHMKIDGNSSAVVVQVLDGTKLYFEVRLRRPPSLRATLAPILGLVEDIRVDRSSF